MKKAHVLLVLLLCTLSAHAKEFYAAKVTLNNGTEYKGFSTIPSNELFSRSIKFKASDDSEEIKYDANDISVIIITSDQGADFTFESGTPFHVNKKFHDKGKDYCIGKNKAWFYRMNTFENMTTYRFSLAYYLTNDGNFSMRPFMQSGVSSFYIAVRKSDESCMAVLGDLESGIVLFSSAGHFRKLAAIYFKDQPAITARIENKEFTAQDIEILVQEYLKPKE